MLLATMPIGVIMQRRTVPHRWADTVWEAVGVTCDAGAAAPVQTLAHSEQGETYLVSGLQLALYPDENDGYFENWVAPAPKVFVMWRMQLPRAMPVMASVSYGEGTRMLDSGEAAGGLAMPPDIHAWLGAYLQIHYRPRPRRGRQHG